jgi:hypothetical protein
VVSSCLEIWIRQENPERLAHASRTSEEVVNFIFSGTLARIAVIFLFVHCVPNFSAKVTLSEKKLPQTELSGLGVEGFLADLAEKYQIPIGIECVRFAEGEAAYRRTILLPPGTLSSLLNKIISEDVRYTWEETNGMIQVHPRENREELLNVLIHNISIEGVMSEPAEKEAIFGSPEVKSKMKELGIKFFNRLPYSTIFPRKGHPVSIHLRDVTLRTVLNEIAKNGEAHCWLIDRWGDLVLVEF